MNKKYFFLLSVSVLLLSACDLSSILPNKQSKADPSTASQQKDVSSKQDDTSKEHVHSFGDWVVVKEPSCVPGTKERVCSGCQEKETESIPANKEHTYGGWQPFDENKEKRVCTVCGHEETRDRQPLSGEIPVLSEDGSTITYGLYPRNHISDETLIGNLNQLTVSNENGWYLYNREYYVKVEATTDYEDFVFVDETPIVKGTSYWFKCEPIEWIVLSKTGNDYLVISSELLDHHVFHDSYNDRTIDGKTIYPCNYQYSAIRTWLNEDFYNTAFFLNSTFVKETIVDNSAATTRHSSGGGYLCEDSTNDKVFLPSSKDINSTTYNFEKECEPTDWTRATGGWYSKNNLYKGIYWTRSPSGDGSALVDVCYHNGYVTNCHVSNYWYSGQPNANVCVRPLMNVTIA